MSYHSYFEPQYVQTDSYYYGRESDQTDELYDTSAHFTFDRHGSHNFDAYQHQGLPYYDYSSNNMHSGGYSGSSYDTVQAMSGNYHRHRSSNPESPESMGSATSRRTSMHSLSHETTSGRSRTSSTSSVAKKHYCQHQDCLDAKGQPTKCFSRPADVQRHLKSQHQPPSIDCPKPRCGRKGENGFTRDDHCKEHLRQYHRDAIPKRNTGSRRGSRGGRHAA
ncbi:hypothetical protein DV736_g2807, partial [Chaetothyriales sp. CBS 134916]